MTPQDSQTLTADERLREAAQAMIEKMDEIRPQLDAMFMYAKVHGFRYTAPGYGSNLEALRAALNQGQG